MTPLITFLFFNTISSCPKISTVENFNLTEYLKQKWYIQLQQETSYLPINENYCVTAQYSLNKNKSIPFYNGEVISIYNYANFNMVNGKSMDSGNFLCGRIPNSTVKSKLLVGPCFLPNKFAGDYWIVDVGPTNSNYEWAIISGGQPTEEYPDGCTTKKKGENETGFWFFTRNQNPNNTLIEFMGKRAKEKGFTISQLNKVYQKNCIYK